MEDLQSNDTKLRECLAKESTLHKWDESTKQYFPCLIEFSVIAFGLAIHLWRSTDDVNAGEHRAGMELSKTRKEYKGAILYYKCFSHYPPPTFINTAIKITQYTPHLLRDKLIIIARGVTLNFAIKGVIISCLSVSLVTVCIKK